MVNAFNKGDIIRVCLNPVAGKELTGDYRPALVLSPKAFNRLGMTLVAPITQGDNFARVAGFTVSLTGTGTETQGVILLNHVRMMDVKARGASKIETVPDEIIQESTAILSAIID